MPSVPSAPPIPGFRLGYPEQSPALPLPAPGKPAQSLAEKYRPRFLAEILGQGAAVFELEQFVEAPASRAFLFSGSTGVGKTTAALCLANELGINDDGGLHHIGSGEQDASAVEKALLDSWHVPCFQYNRTGSRWHLILVDEADYISTKARQLWLSALENLPPWTIVVFTTNHPEKFERRLRNRCGEPLVFRSSPDMLQDADAFVERIWAGEQTPGIPPRARDLAGVIEDGELSFRCVAMALEPIIRAAKSGIPYTPPEPIRQQPVDLIPPSGSMGLESQQGTDVMCAAPKPRSGSAGRKTAHGSTGRKTTARSAGASRTFGTLSSTGKPALAPSNAPPVSRQTATADLPPIPLAGEPRQPRSTSTDWRASYKGVQPTLF